MDWVWSPSDDSPLGSQLYFFADWYLKFLSNKLGRNNVSVTCGYDVNKPSNSCLREKLCVAQPCREPALLTITTTGRAERWKQVSKGVC